jgi:hypothetical protein
MRILITGSREWDDPDAVINAIENEYHCHEHPAHECPEGLMTIVHGHCPTGADHMADWWARSSGYEIERHPADWNTHGKRAGFIRNSEMVNLGADVCLAFIKNESKGATMTAKLAEKAGIPVKIWRA